MIEYLIPIVVFMAVVLCVRVYSCRFRRIEKAIQRAEENVCQPRSKPRSRTFLTFFRIVRASDPPPPGEGPLLQHILSEESPPKELDVERM